MDERDDQLQSIDELIAKATWPAVSEHQVRRLAGAYRREQTRALLARSGSLAAAAVLVLCIGVLTHRLTRPYSTQQPVRETIAVPPPAHSAIASRPASLLERAILLSASPKKAARSNQPPLAPSRDPLKDAIAAVAAGADVARVAQKLDPSVVDYLALLKQEPRYAVPLYLAMVENPSTSEPALAALNDVPRGIIDEMFARLDDRHVAARMAAARALGKIDGPVITSKLAEMVNRDQNRREALAALISSQGTEAERFVARAKRDSLLGPTIQSLEAELKNPS